MHVLGIILTAVAGALYWSWYAQRAAEVGGQVIDKAQQVRGRRRRRAHLKRVNLSPAAAVDHPVVAAATLMEFVGGEDGRERASTLLQEIAPATLAQEALVYAAWASEQIDDRRGATDLLCAKLTEWLDPAEKKRLQAMLHEVAGDGGRDARACAQRIAAKLA